MDSPRRCCDLRAILSCVGSMASLQAPAVLSGVVASPRVTLGSRKGSLFVGQAGENGAWRSRFYYVI